MKLTAAHEPLGDVGRLRLSAFGRRMGGEIAGDSDEDMPTLVGIAPLAELPHAGVQNRGDDSYLGRSPPALKIGGKARNSGSDLHVNLKQKTHAERLAVTPGAKSQAQDYRAKAKEYARLTVITKSLREGRRYRKLAENVLGPRVGRGIAQRSAFKDDREAEIFMTVYPVEFHRRSEQKWACRADASMLYESAWRMGCW